MESWSKVFRSGHDLLLPGQINNGAQVLFLLDTGSGLDMLSLKAAGDVSALIGRSSTSIQGLSGYASNVQDTKPIELRFGHMTQKNGSMHALDLSSISRSDGMEVSGILGAYALHQTVFQIDYRDNLVHFLFDPKRLHSCYMDSPGDCY